MVKSYDEWVKGRTPMFYKMLAPLVKELQTDIIIRKMDDVDNVVNDFIDVCNLNNKDFNIIKDNETPGNEDLFLRALFNSKFKDPVLPKVYDGLIANNIDQSSKVEEYMSGLFPNNESLKNLNNIIKDDREKLNTLLVKQGQKPYKKPEPEAKHPDIDISKLIAMLSSLVLSQSIKIDKLEKDLEKLINNG